MTEQRLHYKMCGLDDVYLLNGFEYKETPRGSRLHIFDQEGLHRAIGRHLVRRPKGLTGRELRFLREELGLSQSRLADLIGESDQSVARREKRDKPYKRPPAQERIIRFLYQQSIIESDETLNQFLSELVDADDFGHTEAVFSRESEAERWDISDERLVA